MAFLPVITFQNGRCLTPYVTASYRELLCLPHGSTETCTIPRILPQASDPDQPTNATSPQFVRCPVFGLSANVLRCWNSSKGGVFLLLFSAKIVRGEMNGSFWPQLEGMQEERGIGAALVSQSSPICNTAHPVPLSLLTEAS